MIKIRTPNLDRTAEEFADRIFASAYKRYNSKKRGKKTRKFPRIIDLGNKAMKCSQEDFKKSQLGNEILKVYLAKPNELKERNDDFERHIERYAPRSRSTIKSVFFNYEALAYSDNDNDEKEENGKGAGNNALAGGKTKIDAQTSKEKHSHWLIRNVNVGVCPYCNRNFVQTHHAAQLDHFYPKAKCGKDAKTKKIYPYLALSFYNLIPCCYQCNHEKSTKIISINPYAQGFSEDSGFKIKNIEDLLLGGLLNDKNKKNWKIMIALQANEKAHNKAFKLEEVYEQHKDILAELVQKAYSYRGGYYDGLIQTFAEMGLKGNEIQTLIFGTPIQEEDIGKRPLSKLTKDILEQLEIY